jgi:hypothetical protein
MLVSPIALGSWRTFERMEREDAERLLAHALSHGIDFLDDARYDDETGSAPLASGYCHCRSSSDRSRCPATKPCRSSSIAR